MVISPPTLYGLVLIGGRSTRMKEDKSALQYHDKPQSVFCWELLGNFCNKVFLSCRKDQGGEEAIKNLPQIHDKDEFNDIGPLGGILSAMQEHPNASWLALACDLPYVKEEILATLIKNRDPKKCATAYVSVNDNLPEPLCAIYESHGLKHFLKSLHNGAECPRKILINSDTKLLQQSDKTVLGNVNTPEEYKAVKGHLRLKSLISSHKTVSVQYYAILREARGCSDETISTTAPTAGKLYEELQERYRFPLAPQSLRVAINDELTDFDSPIKSGDTIVFIPPVAGG